MMITEVTSEFRELIEWDGSIQRMFMFSRDDYPDQRKDLLLTFNQDVIDDLRKLIDCDFKVDARISDLGKEKIVVCTLQKFDRNLPRTTYLLSFYTVDKYDYGGYWDAKNGEVLIRKGLLNTVLRGKIISEEVGILS